MNELSLLITGKALLNGKTFWESVMLNDITNDAKVLKICEEPIIELKNGVIISLKRNIHDIDNKVFYEIIASNITSIYKLTNF